MNKLIALSWLLCLGLLATSIGRSGSALLTASDLALRGGSAKACQCPTVSCISLNPNANSKGGAGCQAVGDACTACPSQTGNEQFFTPIQQCGGNCTGANNQTNSKTMTCTGDISNGTCQKAPAGAPFQFVCSALNGTNVNCLPNNLQAFPPVHQ